MGWVVHTYVGPAACLVTFHLVFIILELIIPARRHLSLSLSLSLGIYMV